MKNSAIFISKLLIIRHLNKKLVLFFYENYKLKCHFFLENCLNKYNLVYK